MSDVNSISKMRAGRRPGKPETRAKILRTAQELFAEHGIDHTSIRQIALTAGVDPALILHYFASKQQLFLEAMLPLYEGPSMLPKALEGSRSNIGLRLATASVAMLSNESTCKLFLSAIRSASSDIEASDMLRDFVQSRMLSIVEQYLPAPDAALKANLVGSYFLGIVMARYILRIEPLASIDDETLVRYLAPRLQSYFDE